MKEPYVMKVCCVILNYNDAETTEKLVERIRDYRSLDFVVIVDNCSTDGSEQRLKRLADRRVHFIRAEKNGGYGYGNNLGIRYACRELEATHVLVANPDVVFTEDCVFAMRRVISRVEQCAVVSVRVKDREGRDQYSGWKLLGFWGDILDTGLITRRLFKGLLKLHLPAGRTVCPAGAVCGSLYMGDCRALLECGPYDENVFLYYEEKILGFKLREQGYRTLLVLNQSYVHMHSVSIDKSVGSILKKQALLHQSKLYYYREYLRIGGAREVFAKIFLGTVMCEIWFLTRVLGMTW